MISLYRDGHSCPFFTSAAVSFSSNSGDDQHLALVAVDEGVIDLRGHMQGPDSGFDYQRGQAMTTGCTMCCRMHGNVLAPCGAKGSEVPFVQRFWPLHMMIGPDWGCMICTHLIVIVPAVLFFSFV